MIKIVSAENMKKSDAAAISSGVAGTDLMQRAAEGVFDNVSWSEPIGIVCGPGNNAGDGYALAEILHDHGMKCTLFMLSNKFTPDGKHFYDNCMKKGVEKTACGENTSFINYKTLVDCIYGTGFHGKPDEKTENVISNINNSGAYVVSVDINSGLDSDNGLCGPCVRSDLTVSIGDYKYGHFLNRAKDKMAAKVNADIGVMQTGDYCRLFTGKNARRALPDRLNYSNKSDYGYIALIGGSSKYSGALRLSYLANAAMRSGAGVVKAAVPECIAQTVAANVLESTVFPLPSDNDHLIFDKDAFSKLISGVKAAAFGMGMGRSEEVEKALSFMLENFTGTLLIDADGINALSRIGTGALKKAACRVILTPHNKEFARLLSCEAEDVAADPVNKAKDFAKEYGAVLLLKGPSTVVTDGDTTYFIEAGCPGMATAGSGDVLSGIIAALCGYNSDPLLAAAAGAFINGKAGEAAQKKTNPVSMTASDTVKCIPGVISRILKLKPGE